MSTLLISYQIGQKNVLEIIEKKMKPFPHARSHVRDKEEYPTTRKKEVFDAVLPNAAYSNHVKAK